MPGPRKYLWKDEEGEVRWHDVPAPARGAPKPEGGRYFGANGWSTGLESDSASVHSSQVNDFREDAKKQGLTGVEFDKSGNVKFSSRDQRARYLQHRGFYDRDAGYGDPTPRNF